MFNISVKQTGEICSTPIWSLVIKIQLYLIINDLYGAIIVRVVFFFFISMIKKNKLYLKEEGVWAENTK